MAFLPPARPPSLFFVVVDVFSFLFSSPHKILLDFSFFSPVSSAYDSILLGFGPDSSPTIWFVVGQGASTRASPTVLPEAPFSFFFIRARPRVPFLSPP